MSIAENIKRIRLEHGLSQAELGKIAGVSDKAVSTWELGLKTPRMGAVEKMAPLPAMAMVPLVGSIACGTPILAQQNIDGSVDAPEDIRCDFALRCKGDSMIDAGIHDGDAVYIRIQPEVENGEIAAVRIGEEATLKRVYYDGTTLTLMPANAAFAPMVYTGPQLDDVHIEGRVVGWTHWVG